MRIVYMGTPDIAATILKRLLEGPDEVVLVVTQPDRPKGRGGKLACPPVKEVALEAGLPVFQPERLREPGAFETIAAAEPDMIVVAAFGQLLPKAILELPRLGCINVHASLLPKYRGAAPIQWAILDGEEETGITIMYMNEGLDTGDILLQRSIPIDREETGGSLHDKLAVLGADALMEAIPQLVEGTLPPVPQGEMTTAYAKQLNKHMGRLDFTQPAVVLERYIRGLNPWPCAYTSINGLNVKVWKAEALSGGATSEYVPGQVVDVGKDCFDVLTGDGVLRILELQPEGKKRMTADAYLRGYAMNVGTAIGEQ